MDLNNLINNFKSRFSKQEDKLKLSIGLDWGFSSLKMVVLESRDNNYILKDARIIALPSQDVKLSFPLNDLDLSGGVNLGICGPNVVVRYIAMTKMKDEEFRNSLRYEAASHLPFPVEEVNLDGIILKELADNQMLAMLVAAKKDFINQRLKIFQESGIRVNILDIDSLALINAFNYSLSHKQDGSYPGAVALLNIGACVTNINILEDGIPHFSRDINVAGRDLTKQVSREATIAKFVSEIRKSFDYYEAGSTAVLKKIFLSGGGSLVPDLGSNLENFLGAQIEKWDAFSNFSFAPGIDEANIRQNSAQFAVAVGLALR
ncbi:MAG: pilus assembly protein PilM [Candidatus Omnitrophica bacterium]|nr:pilus assembly protein PilM [Candidatus Omnitrophota bacterium]